MNKILITLLLSFLLVTSTAFGANRHGGDEPDAVDPVFISNAGKCSFTLVQMTGSFQLNTLIKRDEKKEIKQNSRVSVKIFIPSQNGAPSQHINHFLFGLNDRRYNKFVRFNDRTNLFEVIDEGQFIPMENNG